MIIIYLVGLFALVLVSRWILLWYQQKQLKLSLQPQNAELSKKQPLLHKLERTSTAVKTTIRSLLANANNQATMASRHTPTILESHTVHNKLAVPVSLDNNKIAELPQKPIAEKTANPVTTEETVADGEPLLLQLRAASGKLYSGYELLQIFSLIGFKFGENGLFNYYMPLESATAGQALPAKTIIFSLAAATTDGRFPFDRMGSFKVAGLILFIYLQPEASLLTKFELFIEVATQLAEELEAEIYNDKNQPLSSIDIENYRQTIQQLLP